MNSDFERIQRRAFELYLKRQDSGGDSVSDWLQAEREISGRQSSSQLGPAKHPKREHWGQLTTPEGHDVENPT